jgi:hypothetical protein
MACLLIIAKGEAERERERERGVYMHWWHSIGPSLVISSVFLSQFMFSLSFSFERERTRASQGLTKIEGTPVQSYASNE